MAAMKPDWIAELQVWDGSAWMYLRIGIKEKVREAIHWNFELRRGRVGRIQNETMLKEVAYQVKAAYRKRYKSDLTWFLEAKDILFLTLIVPMQESKVRGKIALVDIRETEYGQFYYNIGQLPEMGPGAT